MEASFRLGEILDRVYPDDPSTDEDVRKEPLVFIPVFHGPVQGGHWSLLVIDRTEYEPGIFNRIPNASQSQTFTFPKCDILIWKRGQLTKCSLFMQEAHCNIFERGFKDINSPLFGLATFHLRSESSLVVITQTV
jgi:hypothetical protein